MTTITELIKVFEKRKCVAGRKLDSNYRTEYYEGVLSAYTEVLSDLYGLEKGK